MNTTQKRGFGARINNWLEEPEGSIFRAGKWRFWLPMLLGFSLLNAVMTAVVFGSGGQLQTYIGAIMLSVGALLAWLCVGTLHYSDSRDVKLARGVSLLDSVTLVFVIAHFCFLLYVQGHVWTLRAAEDTYKASATAYNEKAEKVSSDNVKIAEAGAQAEREATKRARIENDTVYQARKAAQAGARINAPVRAGAQSAAASISTSPIELERPEKPKESSTDFLTRWDFYVRLANFGELALAAITFIYIRNRSAKFNTRTRRDDDEFPGELAVDVIENRSSTGRENFTTKKEPAKDLGSFNSEGLKRLREALRDISFRLAGFSFKANVKDDCVWVLMMKANAGTQQTIHSAKAKLSILEDAMTMKPAAFRERLERFLRQNGFEI